MEHPSDSPSFVMWTPEKEQELLALRDQAATLKAQQEELLKALEWIERNGMLAHRNNIVRVAQDAIAKL